jgi:hypothetical protein
VARILILAAAILFAVPALADPIKLNPILQQQVDNATTQAEVYVEHAQDVMPLIREVRACTGLPHVYPRDWYVDHADDVSLCLHDAIEDFRDKCARSLQEGNSTSADAPCYVDIEWQSGLTGPRIVPKTHAQGAANGLTWDIPGYPKTDAQDIVIVGHARMCVRLSSLPCEA